MITLDTIIMDSIISRNIKSQVGFGTTVPKLSDIYAKSNEDLGSLFDPTVIPTIKYKEDSSAFTLNASMEKIRTWLLASHTALGYVILEHKALSDRYKAICERINNEMDIFRQNLSDIMNYSCHLITSLQAKQHKDSNVGRIGKFTTLPYFLESCKMYNGTVYLRAQASGELLFSNMESINSIPFDSLPSVKFMDINNLVQVTVTCSFPEITLNAIYAKFLNDKIAVEITVFNGTTPVYKNAQDSNEVFFNFEPMQATSINFRIAGVNVNPAKPFSLQLGSLELFKEIVFAQFGSFISVPYEIGEASTINSLSLSHKNDGNLAKTNAVQYISVQTSPTNVNFSRIEQEASIDITAYKYKYSINLDGFSKNLAHDLNFYGKTFFRLPIPKSDPLLWNMNYKDAIIYFGLNKAYTVNVSDITEGNDPYENWTKVGNYWKTNIANYEDNVTIDVGAKTVILNGRSVTGIITMPQGISVVEIHTKDIDFKFGEKIQNDGYNGIKSSATIASDPLYPSNLLYAFAGLPEFEEADLTNILTEKQFVISSVSSIFLNEPVIPMSVNVYDSKGRAYDLVLSKAPSIPGTFAVEANKGRVRICPKEPDTFKVRYRRCNPARKPAGILFNRLLTFMPMKSMVNMLKYNSTDKSLFETYFTIDGDQNERFLMFPNVGYNALSTVQKHISHAILSYNLQDDKIYSSVKVDLTSTNKYLTPIINNIYVTGK